MCLDVNKDYPKQPDGSIRWKLMQFLHFDFHKMGYVLADEVTEQLKLAGLRYDHRAVMGTNKWAGIQRVGDTRKAAEVAGRFNSENPGGVYGIHVCPDMDSLRRLDYAYKHGWPLKAYVKLECTGFIAGGVAGLANYDIPNETWESVKVLEIVKADDFQEKRWFDES